MASTKSTTTNGAVSCVSVFRQSAEPDLMCDKRFRR